jgi:hypothetical protein
MNRNGQARMLLIAKRDHDRLSFDSPLASFNASERWVMSSESAVDSPKAINFVSLPVRGDWSHPRSRILVIIGFVSASIYTWVAIHLARNAFATDAFDVGPLLAAVVIPLVLVGGIALIIRPFGRGFVLGLIVQVVISILMGLLRATFS